MTYNVNIPAAVPRTLVRTPQLNPILAALRNAKAGKFLKGTADGQVMWDDVDLAPGSSVDVTVPVPDNDGAWTLASQGSGEGYPAALATWEGARDALLRLNDTREQSNDSAALLIDVRHDADGQGFVRTGIHSKAFTRPDMGGESSAGLFVQSGGGSSLTTYKTHRLRPDGKPNLAYSSQGALEVATDDMAFAALLQAGAGFGVSGPGADPVLTAPGITPGDVTVPVSLGARYPVPGSPVPHAGATTLQLWPTPLYVQIENEAIAYTGVSGNSLTGCTRGINSTAAAHPPGAKVIFICASNAVWMRFANQVSKGMCAFPADGSSFDARPVLTIGNPVIGGRDDASARLVIRLSGAIETAASVSSTQVNAVNVSVTPSAGPSSVDLSAPVRVSAALTPPEITAATTHDYAPTGLAQARVLRLLIQTTAKTLTGIAAQPAGSLLSVVNIGTVPLSLLHDAGSALANRLLLPAGGTMTLSPQSAVTLWYDATSARWRTLDAR